MSTDDGIVGRCIGCFHNFAYGTCGGCGAVADRIERSAAGVLMFGEVVTLCGSTRFKGTFQEEASRLTLEGRIVIDLGGVYGATRDGWSSETKRMLRDLHRLKIDMAHRVHIINVGGYIGASTRDEITYAQGQGKPVTYLIPPDSNEHICHVLCDYPVTARHTRQCGLARDGVA